MCVCVLQCVAVCCSVLQCVAVCCSVFQCVAVCCSVLQCVAVCSLFRRMFSQKRGKFVCRRNLKVFNTFVAVCCSVCCKMESHAFEFLNWLHVYMCSDFFRFVLQTNFPLLLQQHTATYRNALQRTATYYNTPTHCNALQHTATHCNALQRPATHCNALQHLVAGAICAIKPLATQNFIHHTLRHTATHCNTL